MSRYAEGSIAEVDLLDGSLPLRIDVVDGEALKSTAVSTETGI